MRVMPCAPVLDVRNNRRRMPTYLYKCDKCETEFEANLSIDDRLNPTLEQPSRNCPNDNETACKVELQVVSPPIGYRSTINGRKKPDDAFNDKLKEIKRAHYKSTVNVIQ